MSPLDFIGEGEIVQIWGVRRDRQKRGSNLYSALNLPSCSSYSDFNVVAKLFEKQLRLEGEHLLYHSAFGVHHTASLTLD